MADKVTIMRDRQRAVRREMDRRQIALKVVGADSDIPPATLLSYFPNPDGDREPAVIPMSAVYALIEGEALPLDLLGFLLPAGVALVPLAEGYDYHEVCTWMQDFLATKSAFHHPESEAGEAIGPKEGDALDGKLARLRA